MGLLAGISRRRHFEATITPRRKPPHQHPLTHAHTHASFVCRAAAPCPSRPTPSPPTTSSGSDLSRAMPAHDLPPRVPGLALEAGGMGEAAFPWLRGWCIE
jgi:hypothetical protein